MDRPHLPVRPAYPEGPLATIASRLEFSLDLARRAGTILRQGYGRVGDVHYKGPIDPVTEYDLRSEQIIREAIQQEFPGDSILGEEGGASGEGAGRWLVDPLDGTVNFAHAIPFFCVTLAYVQDGRPVLGVTYDPLRDEMFYASAGQGAWLNGQPLHVSAVDRLDYSLLVTGFPYTIRHSSDNNLGHFAAFSLRSMGVRRLGSASLDMAYVAAGRLDAYWETGIAAWDVAAGMVLVEEAGGRVTRTDGGPDPLRPPISIVASNGRLHDAMLALLNAPAG